MFIGNVNGVFVEVLLDVVGFQKDSAPNELSVEVLYYHGLKDNLAFISKEGFSYFSYSR